METTGPAVSVILSTFDQPNALRMSLLGFLRQTFKDFEIIIGDDGSDDETTRVVERFKKEAPFRIERVWQPNEGYRRALIANKAVGLSRGRTLLFIDGDSIPRSDVVEVHARTAGPKVFCTAGRVMLSPAQSLALSDERVQSGDFEKEARLSNHMMFRLQHLKNLFGVMIGKIKKPKILGCHFSVDRATYVELNGFDNNHVRFNKEDSDLRNRLRRFGARGVSLWP